MALARSITRAAGRYCIQVVTTSTRVTSHRPEAVRVNVNCGITACWVSSAEPYVVRLLMPYATHFLPIFSNGCTT